MYFIDQSHVLLAFLNLGFCPFFVKRCYNLWIIVLYTNISDKTSCGLCTSTYFLVNGPHPVSDDNMSASSFYIDPVDYFGPSEARLNKTRFPFWDTEAGIWAPMVSDTNQYIQVTAMFENNDYSYI